MRFICFYLFFTILPMGMFAAQDNLEGFELVDRTCAMAKDLDSILLSDIRSRAKQEKLDNKKAFDKLLQEKGLFLYAKKQLKIDTKEISKLAEKHIEDILEKSNLTLAKLKESLLEPPYFSTIRQLKNQISYSILEGQVKAQLRSQVKISKDQVKTALIKENREKFQVVFIEIKKSHNLEKEQIALANKIRDDIVNNISLKKLRTLYKNNELVDISEPEIFKKGHWIGVYEKMIEKTKTVSEVFLVNEKQTIVWKIKKSFLNKELDVNDLEELEKQLYEKEIEKRLTEIKNISVKDKEIIVNNCKLSL